jgi:hypothetical protein
MIRNLNLVDKADGHGKIDGLLVEVLELDLVPLGEESVEAEDQVGVAMEQGLDAEDDAGGVDLVALEIAHDLEELVVLVAPVLELLLDVLEVGEGVAGGEVPLRRRRRRRRRHVDGVWMERGKEWDHSSPLSRTGPDWIGLRRQGTPPSSNPIHRRGGT